MSDFTAVNSLPSVVSASRSVPRLPGGRLASRWSSRRAGGRAAQLGGPLQGFPIALQRHLHGLPITPTHPEASTAASLTPPVGGDALDDPPQEFRQGVLVAGVLEPLWARRRCSMEVLALFHVRVRLAQELDQGTLQRRRLLEALP